MPRGRNFYRRQWDGRDWAAWHERGRAHVSTTFFGLDAEVRRIFFALDAGRLQRVFLSYGKAYGDAARQYATRIYPKWRAGEVNPSAETLQRLLQSVPEVLPIHERAELLAHLRRKSRRIPRSRLSCSSDDAERLVSRQLTEMFTVSLRHETPPHVRAALKWLSCDSMQAAETLLRIGEVLEAQWLANAANVEIVRLRQAVARASAIEGRLTRRFAHRVETPYAVLDVAVATPGSISKWLNSNKGNNPMGDLTPRRPDDLLSELTRQLSDADKTELKRVAANQQLSLDGKAREASLQHNAAGAELDRALETAERLQYGEKTSGFSVSGAFKGASGVTNIDVRRAEPAAAMIKWIVVGAVIVGVLYLVFK